MDLGCGGRKREICQPAQSFQSFVSIWSKGIRCFFELSCFACIATVFSCSCRRSRRSPTRNRFFISARGFVFGPRIELRAEWTRLRKLAPTEGGCCGNGKRPCSPSAVAWESSYFKEVWRGEARYSVIKKRGLSTEKYWIMFTVNEIYGVRMSMLCVFGRWLWISASDLS